MPLEFDSTKIPQLHGDAAVYTLGPVVLVLWLHSGRVQKRLSIRVAEKALPKPYLGTRISEAAVVIAALGKIPTQSHVSLVIADDQGIDVFKSDQAPVRPLPMLETDIEDPRIYKKLLARLLRKAPSRITGWATEHQQSIAALLGKAHTGEYATPPGAADASQATTPEAPSTDRDFAAAITAVDGRRVIGWALDREQPAVPLKLEFFVNGRAAGKALADNPDPHPNSSADTGAHGFDINLRHDAFSPPWRDTHELSVHDRATGEVLIAGHQITYRWGQSEGEYAALSDKLDRAEQSLAQLRTRLDAARRRSAHALRDYDLWFDEVYQGTIAPQSPDPDPDSSATRVSAVVPLMPGSTLTEFTRVLDSLLAQEPARHYYIVCNYGQDDQAFEALFGEYKSRCTRFVWIETEDHTTTDILKAVRKIAGDGYCLFLQAGESLANGALACMAEVAYRTRAKVLYADSDHVDGEDKHRDPELRPDFNPDLLLSTPYIGAFATDVVMLDRFDTKIVDGPLPVWQYDLLLHACEDLDTSDWAHVTRILSHVSKQEDTGNEDGTAIQTQMIDVLQSYLDRIGLPVTAELDDEIYRANEEIPRVARTTAARLRWQLPNPVPRVTIVVPTRDGEKLVSACVESIHEKTSYPDYEILLVDNDGNETQTPDWLTSMEDYKQVRLRQYHGDFNWSALNNFAATDASGEILCFLNNDTEIISEDWLSEMVGYAWRADVGVVGAKLMFRDGTLEHGGVIVGANGVAEHAFAGLPENCAGYMMRARLVQNLSAVTGACFVCRRTTFEELGGFEMAHLGAAFSDVDFCLRASEAGYRVVWTPYAKLYHLASQSGERDDPPEADQRFAREKAYLHDQWARELARDPHYNPAFERLDHPFVTLSAAPYPEFEFTNRLKPDQIRE